MSVAFVLPLILQTAQPALGTDVEPANAFDSAFDHVLIKSAPTRDQHNVNIAPQGSSLFSAAFAPWGSRGDVSAQSYLGLQSAEAAGQRKRPDKNSSAEGSVDELDPVEEETAPEFEIEPTAPPEIDNESIDGRRRPGLTGELPDRIEVPVNNTTVRLRYVSCPFAPFLDTAEQNVCEGL